MDRWNKAKNALNAVSSFENRGGVQKKDDQYNAQARIPQPSAPPPNSHTTHSSQPWGENSSYYGYPSNAHHHTSAPSTYQQNNFPPIQGFQPPAPGYDHNPQQGQRPQTQSPLAPDYGGSYPQPQNFQSPPYNPQTTFDGSYTQQGLPHDPQGQFAQGNIGPSPPAQQYSSPTMTPQSSPDNFSPYNSPLPEAQRNFLLDSVSPFSTSQYDNDVAQDIQASFHSLYNEQSQGYATTSQHAPYSPQRSMSEYMYQDSPTPAQRRFTVPVMYHSCAQHWNDVLGRCLMCEPINHIV